MDKRLEKSFDENLRDIPLDPIGLRSFIGELRQALVKTNEPKKRVSFLGQIGVHLRSLGDLEEAQKYLLEALEIIRENELGIRLEVQQKIRLAHVLQWMRDFKQSDDLFRQIVAVCRSNDEARVYLDFALQHAGKNFFDQHRFDEALILFEEAMQLRVKRKAPQDQIDSAALAIKKTKSLLAD